MGFEVSQEESDRMCGKSYFDDDSTLDVKTWCGSFVNNKPRNLCRIDGQQETKHFVQIVNGKTYKQRVKVTATLLNQNAAFAVGPSDQWVESGEIFDALDVAEVRFGGIDVKKKSKGKDIIKVEVEYENNWNFSDKRVIDPNKLVFGVEVV